LRVIGGRLALQAEDSQHRIADELVDGAAMLLDGASDKAAEGSQELHELIGRQLLGHPGEAPDIDHHHGQLLDAAILRPCPARLHALEQRCRQETAKRGAQFAFADRVQQVLAGMAHRNEERNGGQRKDDQRQGIGQCALQLRFQRQVIAE
jgi:hypothetical protein